MNEITYDELIDSVNSMLTESNLRHRESLQVYERKIQEHIKENLDRVIDQTAEINERQIADKEKHDKRQDELELERRVQTRVQNACILLTAGKLDTLQEAVTAVLELENLFVGK